MSLPEFLELLLNDGRVRVDPIFDPAGRLIVENLQEQQDAVDVLEEFEREYRRELACQPPPVTKRAMIWAAQAVQRACSVLTYREFNADQVQRALADSCPDTASVSVVYSVDLTYRFLPDLIRLARAASPDDPLVPILCGLAQEWPLSSVGVSSISVTGSLEFLGDPCLRQLYVDRILAEGDESRLDDPRTHQAVLESIGRHPQLAGKLATRLSAK